MFLSCWKTETFALTKTILIFYQSVIKYQFFLQKINIQISQVFLIFQNFWSYGSIRNVQIATNYSVFDRFCFLCVVCLFWWLYGFIWWVFAIEKLEYIRYITKTKYELVWYNTYSSDLLFAYTNGSREGFVEFCVIEVFKFWVILWWLKDGRAYAWGCPGIPRYYPKMINQLSLGMPSSGIPAFFQWSSVFYSKLYFHSSHDMCFAWSVL